MLITTIAIVIISLVAIICILFWMYYDVFLILSNIALQCLVKLIFKKLGALIKSIKSDITIHGRSLGGVCKGRYLYKFKWNNRKICSLLYSKNQNISTCCLWYMQPYVTVVSASVMLLAEFPTSFQWLFMCEWGEGAGRLVPRCGPHTVCLEQSRKKGEGSEQRGPGLAQCPWKGPECIHSLGRRETAGGF